MPILILLCTRSAVLGVVILRLSSGIELSISQLSIDSSAALGVLALPVAVRVSLPPRLPPPSIFPSSTQLLSFVLSAEGVQPIYSRLLRRDLDERPRCDATTDCALPPPSPILAIPQIRRPLQVQDKIIIGPVVCLGGTPCQLQQIATIQSAHEDNRDRLNMSSQPQRNLASLICQQKWSMCDALLSSPGVSRRTVRIDDASAQSGVTADDVVHFAARFQAPLRIISQLSMMYPESLEIPDVAGRYPIHVAAKWSATPDVIQFLINANPAAVGLPDGSGKTPMHYVGECYICNYTSCLYDRDKAMLQVVKMLKSAAPKSVNLEDIYGMNAIEYALDSDASLGVIKTMQRACRDDWRERSKSSSITSKKDTAAFATTTPRGRRHKDLVNDVQSISFTKRILVKTPHTPVTNARTA